MNFGFVKVACVAPSIKVADVCFNADEIISKIKECSKNGAEIITFSELCLTGYTAGDLFFYDNFLAAALNSIDNIKKQTENLNAIVFIGAPFKYNGLIYDVAFALCKGKIVGVIPKTHLSDCGGYAESRYFSLPFEENLKINVLGDETFFGNKIIFDIGGVKVGAEFGSDLFSLNPPSVSHALAGANVIVNLSSFEKIVGSDEKLIENIKVQSLKLCSGYVICNSSNGESTTDSVYANKTVVAENGKILAQSAEFSKQTVYSEIDTEYLEFERSKKFKNYKPVIGYETVKVNLNFVQSEIERTFPKTPFIPSDEKELANRAELILSIQTAGLEKRIVHTNAKKIVIGLSGGLDSTLALLVAYRAVKNLGMNTKDIWGITMPCFGTTERTFDNTVKLARALKITFKKVDISKCVTRHLKDISHPLDLYDAAYENAQARERTQVIMDIANSVGGFVVGTGDLSELALGWATYNGDHMSMYGVNCSIPKTLVRCLVAHTAKTSGIKLRTALQNVLDTPVSPELLPAENGEISQKTEEIVGPYILHDFFLYYMIGKGFSPKKVYYIAAKTFDGDFSKATILKWLKNFVKRFFSQQFKRSCSPDGVKVGSVDLSPRGEWKMPSDAVSAVWLKELDEISIDDIG